MIFWLIAQIAFAAAAPVPVTDDDVYLELVDDSFSSPLYVTAPEGDPRLFVVERGGRVKVVVNGQVAATPYLNIGHLLPASPGPEQGLLGLAFHPDFATNGRVFLSYTDSVGRSVVARLIVNPSSNSVSVSSLHTVIRVDNPAPTNHNGGMIMFGPDGHLYFGLGDGGGGGDPNGHGQNKNTLLGSILRIDTDFDQFPADPLRNYAIPADNPFVGAAGADEIWVYGVRNPWRFWIDEPSGRMYVADVGQSSREEVTVLESGAEGANLGWNRLEGSACYPPGASCSASGTVLPQVEYNSVQGGASVTGGVVYRGSDIPSLIGTYFYADFISGWVRSFRYTGSVTQHLDWSQVLDTNLVSSFGIDGEGEMYIVSLSGSVWKLQMKASADEFLFYRSGVFKYYDLTANGGLNGPILSGTGYSPAWDVITSIDLEGDGQDEMFFYRSSGGVFHYYNIDPSGRLSSSIRAGTGYSHKWDSVSAVDLDGDGQDEIFFYDRELGLYSYYNIQPNAGLGAPIRSGTGYSLGWDAITAVDLDGDGRDEMFFYRQDGTFQYYDVQPSGSLGSLIAGGSGYAAGWDVITAVDLDGDGQDEMFFYREDGTFSFYNIQADTGLGAPVRSGTNYSQNWSIIASVDLDG